MDEGKLKGLIEKYEGYLQATRENEGGYPGSPVSLLEQVVSDLEGLLPKPAVVGDGVAVYAALTGGGHTYHGVRLIGRVAVPLEGLRFSALCGIIVAGEAIGKIPFERTRPVDRCGVCVRVMEEE
jgi:hypothetical protein